MRNNPLKLVKEPIKKKHLDENSYPHEKLISLIDEISTYPTMQLYSLDTRENALMVYGDTHQEYMDHIEKVLETLGVNHTLRRRDVFDHRTIYSESRFFVSKDGYYLDRKQAVDQMLLLFKELAKVTEISVAQSHKSVVLLHNLQLSEIILKDMLVFVERLMYVDKQLP